MDTGSSPEIGKEKLSPLQFQPNKLTFYWSFFGEGEGDVPHSVKNNPIIYSKPEVMGLLGSYRRIPPPPPPLSHHFVRVFFQFARGSIYNTLTESSEEAKYLNQVS